MMSLYDIEINDIAGSPLDLKKFAGKKILIVNVASECGYTGQYTQLQELANMFDGNLVVIGCPCNDFGGQEPGTQEEIAQFCMVNFGVSFPLTEKIRIKKDPHILYQFLTEEALNGVGNYDVEWNFHKFLINEDGSLYKSISSAVSPLSEEILHWLQNDIHIE